MVYQFDKKVFKSVIAIVGNYVLFSTAWILSSDMLLVKIYSDINKIRNIAILKGMVFVLITAALLFVVVSKYVNEIRDIYHNLNTDNAKLNAVLKMSRQGYYEYDITSGGLTASSGYMTMLGYANKPPQLTLDWWKESIHPDDKENALNTLHRITAGEISEYKIKYRLKTKTGQWKTILSAGMVVEYNTKGKPVCMVGMHTDFEDLLADI